MKKNTIIELKNVSKVYHTGDLEVNALTDINLVIEEGNYLSITGPSGCGKSTLLSLVGLLDNLSLGEYLIQGINTSSLDADQHAELRNLHIGFVFQSFNLIDELTVYENVALPLTYREDPILSSREIEERVNRALVKVDIVQRAQHKPNQLSGGQQQRVAIARALACEPLIMLLDEPTGNLDSANADRVMALLGELNSEGTTICIVTHELRYAKLTDRIVKLHDGKIIEDHRAESSTSKNEQLLVGAV